MKEPCPFKARGRRGVKRLGGPLKAPRRRRAEVVPLSQINWRSRLPGCSVCETHDPTGEPSAVNPPARFGERRLETEPRRGVRHRHCESRRQQLPPSAYRYRASCRLYKLRGISMAAYGSTQSSAPLEYPYGPKASWEVTHVRYNEHVKAINTGRYQTPGPSRGRPSMCYSYLPPH